MWYFHTPTPCHLVHLLSTSSLMLHHFVILFIFFVVHLWCSCTQNARKQKQSSNTCPAGKIAQWITWGSEVGVLMLHLWCSISWCLAGQATHQRTITSRYDAKGRISCNSLQCLSLVCTWSGSQLSLWARVGIWNATQLKTQQTHQSPCWILSIHPNQGMC